MEFLIFGIIFLVLFVIFALFVSYCRIVYLGGKAVGTRIVQLNEEHKNKNNQK